MQENAFNNLPNDDEVESRARAIFHAACEGSDSYHALRLGLARRKALHARTSGPTYRIWAPLAGGAIACCALAIGIAELHPMMHADHAPAHVSSALISAAPAAATNDDADVGGSQMDLVQNLDFYDWLASQPEAAGRTQTARGDH